MLAKALSTDESPSFVIVVFAVCFLFLARGNACGVPAFATGPLGMTTARNAERGANTPCSRCNGKLGLRR